MFCRGWRNWRNSGNRYSKSGSFNLHASNETGEKVTNGKETVPRVTVVK